jgi:uncharacterized damage-inducible protein DinB
VGKTASMADAPTNAANDERGLPSVRRFGWSNMFLSPEDDPRSYVPTVGERATINGYLHAYRQTLELKCAGLDAEQMARRSVPPSNMSLLGLVRHMADVERHWFRQVLSGQEAPRRYRGADDRDADFNGAVPDSAAVSEAWSAWREEVAFAEKCVEGLPDLGGKVPVGDDSEEVEVREVLIHMVEEYARHCGHADLLRERIDGRVGQ